MTHRCCRRAWIHSVRAGTCRLETAPPTENWHKSAWDRRVGDWLSSQQCVCVTTTRPTVFEICDAPSKKPQQKCVKSCTSRPASVATRSALRYGVRDSDYKVKFCRLLLNKRQHVTFMIILKSATPLAHHATFVHYNGAANRHLKSWIGLSIDRGVLTSAVCKNIWLLWQQCAPKLCNVFA